MVTEAQKRASEKYRKKHMDYYCKKSGENAKKMRMERHMYKERCENALEFVKEKLKVFEWYDTDMYYLIGLLDGSVKK